MKTCPHFSIGSCKYSQACGIEIILPLEEIREMIIRTTENEFSLCPYKTIKAIREDHFARKGVWN